MTTTVSWDRVDPSSSRHDRTVRTLMHVGARRDRISQALDSEEDTADAHD